MAESNTMKWLSWQHIHVVLIQLFSLLLLLGMLFSLMHVDISTSKNETDEFKFENLAGPNSMMSF